MAHKYTPEQRAFFEKNTFGRSYRELQALFYEEFGVMLTLGQINSYIGNHKLTTGRTGRFPPGHVPANKGQKGIRRSPATEFKKGNMPQNWKPVGTETVRSDGYTWVKIAEPNKWREKHALIWEAANGPVPTGHIVLFADGNKQNIALENLMLISRAQLVRLNQKNLIGGSADLTRAGLLVADIMTKMAERRRGAKRKRKI